MKQSPSIRRRHSPIGEVKQTSPRRQNSPSPDVSSVREKEYFHFLYSSFLLIKNQQTLYRVEPSSPQSQSSYSPQNSPHLLPSPGNDHGPFSPQQSSDNNGNNQQQQQQPYFTLPTHFDQITLVRKKQLIHFQINHFLSFLRITFILNKPHNKHLQHLHLLLLF